MNARRISQVQQFSSRAWAVKSAALVVLVALPGRGAEILTPEGVWQKGDIAVRDGRAFFAAESDGGKATRDESALPLDRLIAVRFGRPMQPSGAGTGVLSANGDRLSGAVEGLSNGTVRIETERFGMRTLRVDRVSCVLLSPHRDGWRGVRERGGVPGVLLANGDMIPGAVRAISTESLDIDRGTGVRPIPRDRCAAVFLGGADDGRRVLPLPSSAVQIVDLRNGDTLSGRLKCLDGKEAVLTGADGGTDWRIPVEAMAEIRGEGPRVVPLSTLDPARVEEVAQFDERFPFQRDRNLLGGDLRVGEGSYARGLACHSRCRLVYELGGAYQRFLAEIGLDAASRNGEAVFRIEGEAGEIFSSGPVRSGAAPRTVSVDIRGVNRLTLIADFGPDSVSVGDHADWCRALLLR